MSGFLIGRAEVVCVCVQRLCCIILTLSDVHPTEYTELLFCVSPPIAGIYRALCLTLHPSRNAGLLTGFSCLV